MDLSVEDLLALFEEEAKKDGANNGFSGLPLIGEDGLLSSFTSKGRGNVLGYRSGGRPSVEYLGDADAIAEQIGGGSTPAPIADVPEPEPLDPGKVFADQYLVNFDKYDAGEKGLFGGQDVDFLRSQGVSDDDIRKIAQQRSTVQPLPAAVYQRLDGVTPAEQSTSGQVGAQQYASNYTSGKSGYDAGAQGIFGGQDVRAMRSKGYSDDEIRATARAVRATGQSLPNAVSVLLGDIG